MTDQQRKEIEDLKEAYEKTLLMLTSANVAASLIAEENEKLKAQLEKVRGLVEALESTREFIRDVYCSKGMNECHYTRYYKARDIGKAALKSWEETGE